MAKLFHASPINEKSVLERIEAYLDAAPRSAADVAQVGPFTLFRGRGPWQYYARPRLGLDEPISARASAD